MFETDQTHHMSMFAGGWSSPIVRGTRPPPFSGFTLTSIDNYRAILFGGKDGEYNERMSDLYLIDFQTMVCNTIV